MVPVCSRRSRLPRSNVRFASWFTSASTTLLSKRPFSHDTAVVTRAAPFTIPSTTFASNHASARASRSVPRTNTAS